MRCKEVLKALEELAPLHYAESWDNAGLLIGAADKEVKRIMVALDATDEVIYQAVQSHVDLLITHHPMIFKPLKKITMDDFIGKKIIRLIKHDIAYYAMHTNLDIMGMADAAAEKLNLSNTKILEVTAEEKLYKLAVYVPEDSAGRVRTAIAREGAGFIGDYSDCSFNINGVGMYKPMEGTNPYIGTPMNLTATPEIKIETVVKHSKLQAVTNAMLKVHPYEEVAYDIYELQNDGKKQGIGRYGYLPDDISLRQFAEQVKEAFLLNQVRVIGDKDKRILNVAISTGAGKSGVLKALHAKADVLVTGDVDHHTALDALEQGLCIIDAGHYGTEYFMKEFIKKYLYQYFTQGNTAFENAVNEIEVILAQEKDPFQIV